MRISTLFLADYASVREGTLGVMGGFINQLWRPEYPAPLGAYLVAVPETTREDLERGSVDAEFRFWCTAAESDEILVEADGKIESQFQEFKHSHFPITVDLSTVQIPAEGVYHLFFEMGEGRETYTFYARTSPQDT